MDFLLEISPSGFFAFQCWIDGFIFPGMWGCRSGQRVLPPQCKPKGGDGVSVKGLATPPQCCDWVGPKPSALSQPSSAVSWLEPCLQTSQYWRAVGLGMAWPSLCRAPKCLGGKGQGAWSCQGTDRERRG